MGAAPRQLSNSIDDIVSIPYVEASDGADALRQRERPRVDVNAIVTRCRISQPADLHRPPELLVLGRSQFNLN